MKHALNKQLKKQQGQLQVKESAHAEKANELEEVVE
jgi:hypothetical protein